MFTGLVEETGKIIDIAKKTGDFVNIETDLFGKYVEKILKFDNFENEEKNRNKKEKKSNLTMEFLQKNGF